MKQILSLILASFIIIGCSKGKGKLNGNSFYYYNKYIGNKPDAGANIYLFSEDTSVAPIHVECDVSGSFSLDELPCGKYTLIGISKATNELSANQVNDLFSDLFSYPFNLKISDNITSNFLEQYNRYQKWSMENTFNLKAEELQRIIDSTNFYRILSIRYADTILNSIPNYSAYHKWVINNGLSQSVIDSLVKVEDIKIHGMVPNKISLKHIVIEKDKTQSVVIDFGKTYF